MFASTSLLHQRVQLQAARSPAASRAHRRMTIVARGSGRFFIGGERGGGPVSFEGARTFVGPARRPGRPSQARSGGRWARCGLPGPPPSPPPRDRRASASSDPALLLHAAGNWKCNGTIDAVTQLVKDLNAGGPRAGGRSGQLGPAAAWAPAEGTSCRRRG